MILLHVRLLRSLVYYPCTVRKKNKIESTKGGKLLFTETGIIIFQIIL